MSKKLEPATDTPIVVDTPPVKERSFSGMAVQKANVRMHKLSHTMKEVRLFTEATPEITIEELTKLLYPDWEEFTKEEFEGKEWYVEEKLVPLLTKNPADVYQEALEEEQAKILSVDDAKKEFTW